MKEDSQQNATQLSHVSMSSTFVPFIYSPVDYYQSLLDLLAHLYKKLNFYVCKSLKFKTNGRKVKLPPLPYPGKSGTLHSYGAQNLALEN